MLRNHWSTACILSLLAVGTTACRGIPEARHGAPRVELEVAVTFEKPFLDALADADAELQRAIESTILAEADVGLRFYPVATTDYTATTPRPEYLLTVRVNDLEVDVAPGTDGAADQIGSVRAALEVALVKRRPVAPPLSVARADKAASRRPATGATAAEASYSLAGAATDGPKVPRDAIQAAVRTATRESLATMIRAIDREFAPSPAPSPAQ